VAAPPTQFVRTESGSVAYQVVGDGPVDVLVVKGLALPIDLMWDEPAVERFLRGLGSFSRSVWFDQRGVGSSDGIEQSEGRLGESIVDDMLAVVDALGLQRVVVVSVHLPSVPALLFAASHPDRTAGLVISEPVARVPEADDYPEGLPEEIIEPVILAATRDHGSGDVLRQFAPSMAGNERYLRWAGRCARLSTTPSDTEWRIRASMCADVRTLLPSIHVPTLLLWQEGSPLTRLHEYVAANIEHAQVVVLPPSNDRLFFLGDVNSRLNAIESFVTGREHARWHERALMTVMFVDVAHSTEHVAAMGDRRWRELLATCESSWRAELERFRGIEVNTTGDGFVATFDGPGRALRCAGAIVDDVRSVGVEFHVGLHAGEVELRGADIAGMAVHIAARVQALAQPGEILVTDTVKDLVNGSDITFADRGEHELKGVPGSRLLFALDGPRGDYAT